MCVFRIAQMHLAAFHLKWVSVMTTASVCKPMMWAMWALLFWPTWHASLVCKPTTFVVTETCLSVTLFSKKLFLSDYSIKKSYSFEIAALFITYRQQPSLLLYSIDIWPARNSRLTQGETNHYITCFASKLACPYLAASLHG